ncbi:MAG: lysophospholipid acyltransferase family protein [Tunicatimonas sp.]
MKRIIRILYSAWVLFVFNGSMLLLLPLILLPAVAGEVTRPVSYFGLKVWATIFRTFTGVRYRVMDTNHIDRHAAYIYVSNHTSFLDVPALPLFIPGQFRPLGKKELLKIPVLGWIVGTVCVIVDRSDANSRNRSIMALKQLIKRGVSVFIFPEGSMNRTEKPLRPFYDGAFRIAIETQTPVLPMVIINAGKLYRPGTAYVKPGKITVKFGKPIAIDNLTAKDVPLLKQQAYQIMEAMLSE